MAQPMTNKSIEKSAREMRDLISRSQQKLLEIESLLSIAEIKNGKLEQFDSAKSLIASST